MRVSNHIPHKEHKYTSHVQSKFVAHNFTRESDYNKGYCNVIIRLNQLYDVSDIKEIFKK